MLILPNSVLHSQKQAHGRRPRAIASFDSRKTRQAGHFEVDRAPTAESERETGATRQRRVREQALTDALWPGADGDAAHFALTTALHRLRRLLGHDEVVIRQDNEVSLNAKYCWVDIWAVERLLARADASTFRDPQSDRAWDERIRWVKQATELYRGPFLGGDPDAPTTPVVDRLRRRLLRQLVDLGARCEEMDQRHEAAHYYEKALSIDPCAEDVCRCLMITYHALGRRTEVIGIYRACRDALAARGTAPSGDTETLLARLRLD